LIGTQWISNKCAAARKEARMGARPLRLLHASDLRLGVPLHGVAHLDDAVRELFLQAPYEAARQTFDAALARQVDLLVLAGNVVAPSAASPRAERFLADQFARLADQQIDVYWLLAPADSHGPWPARWPFPAHVHPLDGNKPTWHTHLSGAEPRARIFAWHPKRRGKKWPAESLSADGDRLPSIGLVFDPDGLRADRPHPFDYLALGGRHARHTAPDSKQPAHYCGSPQGRSPLETGPHGATLVEISSEREVRIETFSTDTARWIDAVIAIDPAASMDRCIAMLDDRIRRLVTATPDRNLLISWSMTGPGHLVGALAETSQATDVLTELRGRHAANRPMAWSVALSVEPTVALPADWQSQQTILGDFLRLAERHRTGSESPLGIEAFLPPGFRANESFQDPPLDWTLADSATRQGILARVQRLGMELLGEPQSVDRVRREPVP